MSRSARDIQKTLAEFGERQFKETGAKLVEVLRVKAAVIRKYWKQMKGIAFIVAVVSSDRVRVYFFTSTGVMLIGENIEHDKYNIVRTKSKLVMKYEKPTPPTELDLRMDATEEVRSELTKSIRKVARFLGVKEPSFPTVFVSSRNLEAAGQSFGMIVADDGAFIFQEDAVNSSLFKGLAIRTAILAQMSADKGKEAFSQCFGNAVASSLLKGKDKSGWDHKWFQESKDDLLGPIIFHLHHHGTTYGADGFSKILNVIRFSPSYVPPSKWIAVLDTIHSTHEVSLGTEAWHTIDGFCKTLSKSRKLVSKRYQIHSIHLSPRILTNPTSLGMNLGISIETPKDEFTKNWLDVQYHDRNEIRSLILQENSGEELVSIQYTLRLEDIIPKTGGIESKGKDVLRWALKVLGIEPSLSSSFEASIEMESKPISEAEKAVLERLCGGSLEVLANTLVGSPQRVESLIDSGCIALVPDFAHLGVNPNLLIIGASNDVLELVQGNVLEATILTTVNDQSYAIISAPSIWGNRILEGAIHDVSCFPIKSATSERRIIRDEQPFPSKAVFSW
ncbi:MAG: hypothetical protein P1Q69_06230 [Candidatus Thorarchaeota archaeon]|nr:hypothetical protein [Candidatus Thorarchaeota archaeon]